MLDTRGVELIAEGTDNTVIGAVLVDADGARIRVKAKKVILATGGFGADPSMVQAHVGVYVDQGVPRTVPFNTGAGQRMAMALGAQLTPAWAVSTDMWCRGRISSPTIRPRSMPWTRMTHATSLAVFRTTYLPA